MTNPSGGRLTIVGTPIGNLGDISFRATKALTKASIIACEDSRRTGRLLAHLGIKSPGLIVVNAHLEFNQVERIVALLGEGNKVALVTDAGMPTISDPGQILVKASVEAGFDVEVIPGPTAVSAAIAVSGLDASRYVFEGFIPRKGRERSKRIASVANESRPCVMYEAPHRLVRTLRDLAKECGPERKVVLARELTKMYEEVLRCTLAEALSHFDEAAPRGEFVLIVDGFEVATVPATDDEIRAALAARIELGDSRRDAVAAVVAQLGEVKRRVYELVNQLER